VFEHTHILNYLHYNLNEIPDIEYDFAITMGCDNECPHVRAKQRLDWAIPDPKNMNEPDFKLEM